MIYCPHCSSTTVGRIGTTQYYCWNCFYEFGVKQQKLFVYDIVEDGSLIDVTKKVMTSPVQSRLG